MLKSTTILWVFSLVMLSGAAAVAVTMWRLPRCSKPSEHARALFETRRDEPFPEIVWCYFSKTMRTGDPIGFLSRHPCDSEPLELSHELESLVTIGDDRVICVADADRLRKAYDHAGGLSGTISSGGRIVANVRLVRAVSASNILSDCSQYLNIFWAQPRLNVIQSMSSIDRVLFARWDEIECCLPRGQSAVRSADEVLSEIASGRCCDTATAVREAILAAVLAARSQGLQTSEERRNAAMAVVERAYGNLRFRCLEELRDAQSETIREYEQVVVAQGDEDERVRQMILLYVDLQVKHPARRPTPLSPEQVWTVIRF